MSAGNDDGDRFMEAFDAARQVYVQGGGTAEDFENDAVSRYATEALADPTSIFADKAFTRIRAFTAHRPDLGDRIGGLEIQRDGLALKTYDEEERIAAEENDTRIMNEQAELFRAAISSTPKQMLALRNRLVADRESMEAILGDSYAGTVELIESFDDKWRRQSGGSREKSAKVLNAFRDRMAEGKNLTHLEIAMSGMNMTDMRKAQKWTDSDPDDPGSPWAKELAVLTAQRQKAGAEAVVEPLPDPVEVISQFDDEQYKKNPAENRALLQSALLENIDPDSKAQFNVRAYASLHSPQTIQDANTILKTDYAARYAETNALFDDFAREPEGIPTEALTGEEPQLGIYIPDDASTDEPAEDDGTAQILKDTHAALSDPWQAAHAIGREALDNMEINSELGIVDYASALGTGLVHGAFYDGPMQFGAAVRWAGRYAGWKGWADWGDDVVNSLRNARENNPVISIDPRWGTDEVARSLYEGGSVVTSGLEMMVPTAAVTAGAVKLTGGAVLVGSLAKLGTLGTAMSAGSVAQNLVSAAASADGFIEDALAVARLDNPGLTYEDLNSTAFNAALAMGASELITGVVSDAFTLRVAGILGIGKASSKQVLGKFGFGFQNAFRGAVANMGEEAASAAFEVWIKDSVDLPTGDWWSMLGERAGPAAVAGTLGGIQNTALSFFAPDAKTRMDDTLRKTGTEIYGKDLSVEGLTRFEEMVNAGKSPAEAHAIALAADAIASRDAAENGVSKTAVLTHIDTDLAFTEMVKLARDADASFSSIADKGIEFLWNRLSPDAKQEVAQMYGGNLDSVDMTRLSQDLQEYVRSGTLPLPPPDTTIPGAEGATSFGEDAMSGVGPEGGFEAMRNVLADSIGALEGNSKMRVSRDAVAALGLALDTRSQPITPFITHNPEKTDTVLSKWTGEDLSDPAKYEQFLNEVSPTLDFDFFKAGVPKTLKGAFEQIDTALKPFTDLIQKNSGVRSDADTRAAAGRMQGDPVLKDFIDSLQGTLDGDAKVVRMGTVLNILNKQVENLGKNIVALENPQMATQGRAYAGFVAELNELYRGTRREQARTLRAGRVITEETRETMAALKKARSVEKDFVKSVADVLHNPRDGGKSDLVWWQMMQAGGKARAAARTLPLRTRWGEAFIQHINSNLLSGPSTQVANLVGNSFMVVNEIAKTTLAEFGMGRVQGGVVGGETLGMLHGLFKAFGDLRQVWENTTAGRGAGGKTQETTGRISNAITAENLGISKEKNVLTGGLGGVVDLYGKMTQIPFFALELADNFFKHVGESMLLNGRILREAERASGGDAGAKAEILAKWSKRPPQDMIKQVREDVKAMVFQQKLEGNIRKLDDIRQNCLPLRLAIPFLPTPVNILKTVGSMTPGVARILKSSSRALNSSNAATRQLAESQLMLGTAMYLSFLSMAAGGMLTGDDPVDRGEREKKRATGWQANSLYLNGEYYGLDRFDPPGLMANLAATTVELLQRGPSKESAGEAGLQLLGFTWAMVAKRSYMEALGEFLEFVNDPAKKLGSASKRVGGMVFPFAAVGRTINRSDPLMREADGLLDSMKMTIPGMSKDLPIRRDFLGQPMASTDWAGSRYLSPARKSKDKLDPVYDEIWRLENGGFETPTILDRKRQRNGVQVKMNAREYNDFLDIYGNQIKDEAGRSLFEALTHEIHTEAYAKLDDDEKGTRLKALAKARQKEAYGELVERTPRLRKAHKLQQEGISKIIKPIFANNQ